MKITAPAFENKGWITTESSGYGIDIYPELHLEGIPQKTEAMKAAEGHILDFGELYGRYR